MAVLTTGNTFSNGNQVTASSLNNAVNDAEFAAGAVDGLSTQKSGSGAIIVKDLGISRGKIAIDAVGTDQLANDVVINTSGSITGAAGSFTTLAASGDVTFDTDTLKVDSTNNRVGIGTASPTQPLDVNGQARVVGNLFVGTDDTTPNGMIEVYGGGSGQNEGGEIRLRTAADFDTTYNHYFIDAYEDDLRIGREGGADITLTSDGNVGIGIVTPNSKLQIKTSASEVEGIPFVTKAAHRYMQFDPENYPVADYKFNATSTLGIIAREYEVTQLVQLLQTMKQDSPLYPVLIQSIIDNMNLSNREELIAAMQKASQPDPQAQQMAQMAQQAQIEFQQSQTSALSAQAAESQARAAKYAIEAQLAPEELQIEKIEAITRNLKEGDQEDKEFERRLKVADRLLKEKQLTGKSTNDNDASRNDQVSRPNQPSIPRPVRQIGTAPNQAGPFGGQSQ